MCIVLDVYLYNVVSPPVRGFPAYLHTCICMYMWPLAPMEYNSSIPNMVSEWAGFPHHRPSSDRDSSHSAAVVGLSFSRFSLVADDVWPAPFSTLSPSRLEPFPDSSRLDRPLVVWPAPSAASRLVSLVIWPAPSVARRLVSSYLPRLDLACPVESLASAIARIDHRPHRFGLPHRPSSASGIGGPHRFGNSSLLPLIPDRLDRRQPSRAIAGCPLCAIR
jgi:hypothetical protein